MLLAGDVIDPFAGIRADVAFDALSDHWKTNFESKYSNLQNSDAAAIQPSAMGSPQRRNASQSAILPRGQSVVLSACKQTRSAFCRPDISLSMLADRSSVPLAKAAPIRKTSPGAPNPRLGQALKNCRSKQKMKSPECGIGEKEHA